MDFKQAITEILNNKNQKFHETIDLAICLNINAKKQDNNVRDHCSLPFPIPREIRLIVIDDTLTNKEVEELGILHHGTSDLIEKIQNGWLDFDLIITTQHMMPRILRLGKILGPKGLMPTSKSGTVTSDLKKTIMEFKRGKTEFKNDSFGNLHVSIGKTNFDLEKLNENFQYFINYLKLKKPTTVKGQFIKKISISSTMGKSYIVDL